MAKKKAYKVYAEVYEPDGLQRIFSTTRADPRLDQTFPALSVPGSRWTKLGNAHQLPDNVRIYINGRMAKVHVQVGEFVPGRARFAGSYVKRFSHNGTVADAIKKLEDFFGEAVEIINPSAEDFFRDGFVIASVRQREPKN